MPENSIPGGPGRTIVALLVVFGVGGTLGMIYTILRQSTARKNIIPLTASAVVLIGFVVVFFENIPFEPPLLLLGAALIAVAIVGLKPPHE